MKKRIFFIVQQLNIAGSAEYLAALMSSHLTEDYDVFLYSLEPIEKGKVHPSFNLSPRIRLNSLNLPLDYDEKLKYISEHTEEIKEFLSHSAFENDLFFIFTRFDANLLPAICKKVWVDGFEDMDEYEKFDASIFFSQRMLKQKSEQYASIKERFIYLNPCARFPSVEDFKFHGNHLLAITKLENKNHVELLVNLVKELKMQELKFLLTISCQGTYLDYFKELINKNDVKNNIEIVSFDEIKNGLSNADLLIYTSQSTFLPMTLVEAIVNSVPVICASKNEYAKELLQDCGVVIKEEELINTIINILKDKIKLSKMKFATYESSHRFSTKESLKSLVKLISILEN